MVVHDSGAKERKVRVVEEVVRVGRWVDKTASEGLRRDLLGQSETGVEGGEFGGGESGGRGRREVRVSGWWNWGVGEDVGEDFGVGGGGCRLSGEEAARCS